MNPEDNPRRQQGPTGSPLLILERVTAFVLVLVVVSLGWILYAAYQPGGVVGEQAEAQIIVILGLLIAALMLVSIVALLHTRGR